MPNHEYRSLKEHLDEVGIYYRQAVDIILQAAQEGAEDDAFDFYPEDYEYDFNFLEDRELITEMLAERPEVAFVEHHNNGFSLRLREQAQGMTPDESAFAAQMQHINSADMGNLGAWLEHARSLSEAEAEALGASQDACCRKLLADFGSVFQDMEQKYPGSAAAIFNHQPGYLPNELLPAADWIHNGGTAEEAYAMAKEGAFELGTFVARGPKALTQAELEAIAKQHDINLNNPSEGACADFSGRLLYGLEMRNMNLCGANFSGAVLRECDMGHGSFDDCDFSGASFHAVQAGSASFEQSNFTGACFENCNFWAADFECGDFTSAVFGDTNFDHATLDGGTFHCVRFEGTDLSAASTALATGLSAPQPEREAQDDLEVIYARHTLWRYGEPDGVRADFSGMAMTKLDFSGKIFDQALFRDAELSRCKLDNCSLVSADFDGAGLSDCDFRSASCQEASFAGARLCTCDFLFTELGNADFSGASIFDCSCLDDQSPGPALAMGGGKW